MDEDTINVAIFFTLKYFNSDDLYNMGQVCRSWYYLAKYGRLIKNSSHCIVDEFKINHRMRWIFKDRYNINYFIKIPCLQIFFTNHKNDINLPSDCSSKTKPFNSFTINLKSYYNILHGEEINPRSTITIPAEYFKELTTFSFINYSMDDEYSNEQQYLNYVHDKMKIHTLLTKLIDFYRTRNPNSIVMIIFCQSYFFLEFLDLMHAVESRIPLDEITIWAATIDALSLCRFGINKHYCRMDSKYLFVFINNPDLNTYVGFLDENCNNADKIRKELRKFKSKTEFSSNSIALMHVSYARLKEFYALDISIFKDVFPNVCLFPFYGDRSFSTNGIISLLYDRKRITMQNMKKLTSFIILSPD